MKGEFKMKLDKHSMNWTAKELVKHMEKGDVNFDNAIQRGFVWDRGKKSLLIHSMIYGYDIPALYFVDGENGVYDSLDGKQRSNTICEFIKGEFTLSPDLPLVINEDGEEENISGCTFSELPEWAQDTVKDYVLTIVYYKNVTDHDIREFFRRLNNGKPLTAIEITRVNTPCLDVFQEIAKHNAIQSVITEAAKKRFTDENIAMQIYNMYSCEDPDFSTKVFRDWVQNLEIDMDIVSKINGGLDLFLKTIVMFDAEEDKKLLKKIKTRTNFVGCALLCIYAFNEGCSVSIMKDAISSFFSGKPSLSDEYNKSVGSGSAKPNAVKSRKNAIIDFFNQHVKNSEKRYEFEESGTFEETDE